MIHIALPAAAILLMGRGVLLLARDHFATGAGPASYIADHALARLGLALPREALVAVVVGLLWALLTRAALRRGRLAGAATALVAAVLAAGYWTGHLTGWLYPDPTRTLGWSTERGKFAYLAIGALSLVLTAVWQLLLSRRVLSLGVRSSAFALGILLVAPVALRSNVRTGSDMTIQQVISEIALDGSWKAVVEHPKRPVRATMMSPSTDWRRQGGERPSLEMVPPSEVLVQIPEGIGACRLFLSAGVHINVWRRMERLPKDRASLTVRFEVLLDGVSVFDAPITVDREDARVGTDWVPVAPNGILVRGGEEVTLRTHVPEDRGPWIRPILPLLVGFGDLKLVRERTVPRAEATPERPNVVFIVMDTLRADRTSSYGYERETTPNLDQLAERGMLFEQPQSAGSYTWPATGSLLTGLLPERHGVVDGDSCYLSQGIETLAEVLQDNGYTTAAFTGNPLIVPGKGFGQGFEFFDHSPVFRKSAELVPPALEWLELYADRRFFAYFQLVDPHEPLEPSAEARELLARDVPEGHAPDALTEHRLKLISGEGRDDAGELDLAATVPGDSRRWISDLYDASVYEGDIWLGRIVETLDRIGALENTVIVFTSDHGEELFDHGLAGHGQSLHQELISVPLVIAGAGIPAGTRYGLPVSTRHLAPTLAAIGGGILDVPGALDLVAPSESPDPIYFSSRNGWWKGWHRTPLFGARDGDLILHWAPEAGEWGAEEPAGPQWSLFDLNADPGELRDVSLEQAQRAEELRAWLEAQRIELESAVGSSGLGASEATRELLRNIGYEGD